MKGEKRAESTQTEKGREKDRKSAESDGEDGENDQCDGGGVRVSVCRRVHNNQDFRWTFYVYVYVCTSLGRPLLTGEM